MDPCSNIIRIKTNAVHLKQLFVFPDTENQW